jgi:hypothetical protein
MKAAYYALMAFVQFTLLLFFKYYWMRKRNLSLVVFARSWWFAKMNKGVPL